MFSDLECDYINPIELCSRLNAFVIPEFIIQLILTALFLLTFRATPLVFHGVLTAYHYMKYFCVSFFFSC